MKCGILKLSHKDTSYFLNICESDKHLIEYHFFYLPFDIWSKVLELLEMFYLKTIEQLFHFEINSNKIRDLFKVKLFTIRS